MNENDPTSYSLLTYGWVMVVSGWGGVVTYLRKRRDGVVPMFSFMEFVGELVTSAFAGLVTFFLCEAGEVAPMLAAAMIAISGHMGSRAIYLIENQIRSRKGPIDGA